MTSDAQVRAAQSRADRAYLRRMLKQALDYHRGESAGLSALHAAADTADNLVLNARASQREDWAVVADLLRRRKFPHAAALLKQMGEDEAAATVGKIAFKWDGIAGVTAPPNKAQREPTESPPAPYSKGVLSASTAGIRTHFGRAWPWLAAGCTRENCGCEPGGMVTCHGCLQLTGEPRGAVTGKGQSLILCPECIAEEAGEQREWLVTVDQSMYRFGEVRVVAASENRAVNRALEAAARGSVEWRPIQEDGGLEPVEVVSV